MLQLNTHADIVLSYDFGYTGAIIMGDYKLIVGKQPEGCDSLMWTPLDYPCHDGLKGENCDPYCLYNIVDDPSERKELSQQQPDILKKMVKQYSEYAKEPRDMQDQGVHYEADLPVDDTACSYMKQHGEYWQPWK